MDKILIVGHPASGYEDVEELLNRCGMHKGLPSKRDGLSPINIDAILCRAHRVPPLTETYSEDDLQQVRAGAVWNGMALDLLLGNLDQPLWGWSDPQAIFLLDYWKELDPKLTFVLVYDEPHRVLTEAARVHGELPAPNNVQRMLDNWVAYNGALLRFYLRHQDRCLLVHSQQVRRAVDSYLQQLQPLLDTPLLRAPEAETVAAPAPAAVGVDGLYGDALPTQAPVALPVELESALAVAGIEPRKALDVFNATAAEEYVVDAVLASHPAALQLYAELQSAANLPMGGTVRAKGDPAAAWQALVQQRTFVTGWVSELHAEYRRVREELAESFERVAQLTEELKAMRAQAEAELMAARAKADAEAKAAADRAQELGEENELLLNQLHQVQEELERYYLENQRLKQKLAPPKPPGPYGAADRIKRQLSYRLGAVMIERSRSVGGWLSMPWALAAEVRAFRQEAAARPAKKLPPIHTYRDAHEAERVKQHLSYRLGSTLLQHGKSPLGWLKLPFALQRQVREFRLQRKRNEK